MSSYKGQKYYDFKDLKEYDLNKCLRLPLNEYVVIDIETTGLKTSAEIIEVCALHIVNGNIKEKYSSLVDYPERKTLPKEITEITGITINMLHEEGSYIEDVLNRLIDFIGDKPICCHNAKFDINFLKTKFKKYINKSLNNNFIDTLYISREFLSEEVSNHKLPTIAKHFDIDTTNLHRAEGDCIITYQVYEKLKEFLKPEFENQNVNYDEFIVQDKPVSCSKLLIIILGLIFLTPITLSYLVWKNVNGNKGIKIFIIILIWFIYLIILTTNIN